MSWEAHGNLLGYWTWEKNLLLCYYRWENGMSVCMRWDECRKVNSHLSHRKSTDYMKKKSEVSLGNKILDFKNHFLLLKLVDALNC
jgi:hypothetical protein